MSRITFDKYGISFKGIYDESINVLKNNVPIITSNDVSNVNKIIEGENIHAMIALMAEYEGKVKLLITDPPYFTGNNDFYYNDKFVDKEDGDANSKYCSFLYQRFELVRDFLTEDGFIAVFCDNNQMFNIKTKVMDPIFGEKNFINLMLLQTNSGGRSDEKHIATTTEYLLVYAKNKENASTYGIPEMTKGIIKTKGLRKEGSGDFWYDRKDCFYPFVVCNETEQVSLIKDDEYKNFTNNIKEYGIDYVESNEYKELIEIYKKNNKTLVLPFARKGGYFSRWRWSMEKDTYKAKTHLNSLFAKKDSLGYNIEERKESVGIQKMKQNLSDSQYDGKNFSNKGGKNILKENCKVSLNLDESQVKEHVDGSTPKNPYMLRDIILNFTNDDDLVMDIFGGSMMTYIGVMMSNILDDSERQFIGVTNNEGNHFYNLALPNIDGFEKINNLKKSHMVCEVKTMNAEIEEDQYEQFFKSESNIFCDLNETFNGKKSFTLRNILKNIFNSFK